jgi:Carboxypeptidase regulatory-like domain/TonB dependent receptor/TonB-dependent Receptor Plug Domain
MVTGAPTTIRRGFLIFATIEVLLLLMCGRVFPQVVGATLSGTVTDQSGAVIPNAQVSIKNVATGVTRDLSTDAAGFYTAPNLLAGAYEVTTSAQGFATQVRTGITLTVGAQQVLNLAMQVGKVTEKVQVAGEAPTVQLASSAISAVVGASTVVELPLNGRSWTDLASLQPGVAPIETQKPFGSNTRGNRGFGAQLAISGARPQQNNYRLDGISINDYANGGPGSVLGGNLGVDSIQEFSVLTSNYSAEYGKTSGGVVNAISRSGTNQFHGSAYEFLRNSALDARDFFDRSTPAEPGRIPPFKRNQFGGSASGPIRKDRTFIFGDFEGIRQSKGISQVDVVPSPAARSGQLCTPPSCATTTQMTVDPLAQKYLGFYALPNGPILCAFPSCPPGGGDTGIFTFAGQQVVNENYLTSRVDHEFSEKDSIFGTYLFDRTPFAAPDNLNDVELGALTKRQIIALEESHIFSPALVNSLRFGFNRDRVDNNDSVKAINPLTADTSLGAVPGHAATDVVVQGLTHFGGGLNGPGLTNFRWNSFQAFDDAFLTKGLHSLKFGIGFERDQLNQLTLVDNNGQFSFSSLANFLTNKPRFFSLGFPTLLTPRGLRQSIFGLYIQDDWHWRPNLTLNLGLRYEMSTVPTEVQGKLSNLYNLTDATPHLGNPFFSNPTLRNFEPRLGFAWDPSGSGKTAVRGGFGIFDALPMLYQLLTLDGQAFPFFKLGTSSKLPPGAFPFGGFALLGAGSFQMDSVERAPHRNYVMQWNFNVQRELAPNLTALIGYVGSRGVHQAFRVDDGDVVIPRPTSAGYLYPSPITSGTTINPNAGAIRYLNWGGDSFYDALQLGLSRRMSHGLQMQASYTWGKSIDTSSGVIAGDTLSNSISSLDWFDLKLTRAVSDFNIGRTLVISGTWQLPGLKSASGPVAWVTNGWQLGGIFKANDGVPFSATFGTDGDPVGKNSSDTYSFPNRLTGPGCSTLINSASPNNYIKTQCFAVPTAPSAAFYTANCDAGVGTAPQCFNLRGNAGRNIMIGPGTSNLDFSVFKNNYIKRISEDFNVQFRAEFFNVLNRANFAVPVLPDNTDIFDSTGTSSPAAGLLTSTVTTSREIQFALKLVW